LRPVVDVAERASPERSTRALSLTCQSAVLAVQFVTASLPLDLFLALETPLSRISQVTVCDLM